MSTLHRREFLKQTTTVAAAIGLGGSGCATMSSGKSRWPIACRDSHLNATGQPDCWAAMKYLGIKHAEVTTAIDMTCGGLYHPTKKYSLANTQSVQELRDDLKANDCAISALCMSNRLDEQLEKELEWMKKMAAVAGKFGVKTIRIDVVPRAIKRDQFLPFAIKACKQLCEISGAEGIRLGIENHGNTTNDPDFLEKLFDGVGSDYLGLTLDPANFYWYGHPLKDLYPIYEKFAKRAFHTHCKTIHYPEDKKNIRRQVGWEYDKYTVPVYEGDIDYARVVEILRRANYQGDLCLENECLGHFPKAQAGEILKKELELPVRVKSVGHLRRTSYGRGSASLLERSA